MGRARGRHGPGPGRGGTPPPTPSPAPSTRADWSPNSAAGSELSGCAHAGARTTQPEVSSRCCSRSWAASSTFLCRHSEARYTQAIRPVRCTRRKSPTTKAYRALVSSVAPCGQPEMPVGVLRPGVPLEVAVLPSRRSAGRLPSHCPARTGVGRSVRGCRPRLPSFTSYDAISACLLVDRCGSIISC